MKKCPFCAEEIQDEAIKCKHCSEFLDGAVRPVAAKRDKDWYLGTTPILIALFCVGPFALPLIWMRPQTSRAWKIGLTIVILVLSGLLTIAFVKAVKVLIEYYGTIMEI